MECDVEWLRALIRTVPDFPNDGVNFADIGPLLANADALRCAVELLADEFVGTGVDVVAAVDARGFILGAPIAVRLGCGFTPLRKSGKLPAPTVQQEFALEYGTAILEMSVHERVADKNVLVIDDVLATGGTAGAAVELIRQSGAAISGLGFLSEIRGLEGRQNLQAHRTVVALGAL